MVSYASLDKNGNLLTGPKFSLDPHKKQDPASITKIIALDTMMEHLGDRWPKFAKENAQALHNMMANSHNGYTNQLACKAMNPNIGDVSNLDNGLGENYPTAKQKVEIEKFVKKMNENAAKVLGFKEGEPRSTNFATVEGMPREQHYTTAYDMARMMRHFEERPKSQTDLAGFEDGTVYALNTHKGVKGFKTGTAGGVHGDWGRSSGLGATDNGGAFCVLGVFALGDKASSEKRNNLCIQLADRINTGITADQQGEIMFSHGDGGKGADPHDIQSVKEIQKALGMKEQYQTGYYGDKTTAAVLKFQKDYNIDKKKDEKLPETGTLDERSYKTLVVGAVVEKKIAVEAPASSAEALAITKKAPAPEKKVATPAPAAPPKQEVKISAPEKNTTVTVSAPTPAPVTARQEEVKKKEPEEKKPEPAVTNAKPVHKQFLHPTDISNWKPKAIDTETESAISKQTLGKDEPATNKQKAIEEAASMLKSGAKLSDTSHKPYDTNFTKSNIPVVSNPDKSIV